MEQSLLPLLRPIRIFVLPIERELQQIGAVDAHPIDLPPAAAVGLEGDPFAVGRPGRLFVRAFAGQDAALVAGQIGDADLKASVDARGVGDLRAVGRPGGVVVPVAFERDALHVRAFGVHRVNLRRSAPSRRERNLPAVGTPLRSRLDR